MAQFAKERIKTLLLPLSFSAGAALLSWTLAIFAFRDFGWVYGSAFILIGLLAAASAGFYRYKLNREEAELAEARARTNVDRQQLLALKKSLESDALGFEKQRQSFEDRLITYHEWTEFPDVQQFAEAKDDPEEVTARDRQVLQLVQGAADQFLSGFQSDRYSVDGEFEPRLILDELTDFVSSVARIYKPGSKEPLLETSVETLLKSVNHVSLQLLFQLEQLPLNLKDYSLARAYDHIRKASRAYEYYKSVSPVLPYVSYTWQVGRLVMGANPIVAGAWMLGSEIIKRAGRKISKEYIDRYSLKLTGEAIRIIANETAMTFDSDFRYRDPNWIYGLELAELVHQFPLSRETLQVALCDIGSLPLRNSYDRIFLYRCLAAGKSPQPGLLIRAEAINGEQRREIAERLERFFRNHVHGRRRERVESWMAGAAQRIGVQIRALEQWNYDSPEDEAASALRSLGAFLIAVKDWEPEQLRDRLEKTEVAAQSPAALGTAIEQLLESPPMFFDYPDLEPDGAFLTLYLSDLVDLETAEPPADLQGYWAVQDVAAYFRQDWAPLDRELIEAYRLYFSRHLWPDAPRVLLDKRLVVALPRILESGERPLIVYPRAGPVDNSGKALGMRLPGLKREVTKWLVGTNQRLLAIEIREGLELDDFHQHRVFWYADAERAEEGRLAFEQTKGLTNAHCRIQGGDYANGSGNADEDGLRVSCEKLKSFEKYFAALRRWVEDGPTAGARD